MRVKKEKIFKKVDEGRVTLMRLNEHNRNVYNAAESSKLSV